jgi:lipoate-protein ligase A
MARDHALAATLIAGEAVLRFYGWSEPTLSFGRNEPARDRWNLGELEARGVHVVRRPTGGRAVLHHRELTYAVVLPLRERPGQPGPRAYYRAINEALVAGLAQLDVEVELASDDQPPLPPDSGPCFQQPAPGEVVARGRKLIGSAQARLEGRLLQHGSLLLHDDQVSLTPLSLGPGAAGTSLAGPPVTLAELVQPLPDMGGLVSALARGFRARFAGHWPRDGEWGTLTDDTRAAEARLRSRYTEPVWTWRR